MLHFFLGLDKHMPLFDFFWLLSPLQPTSRVSLDLPRKPFLFPIDFSTRWLSPLPSLLEK